MTFHDLGKWKANVKHGTAEEIYLNGDKFIGTFVDGKRQGFKRFYYGFRYKIHKKAFLFKGRQNTFGRTVVILMARTLMIRSLGREKSFGPTDGFTTETLRKTSFRAKGFILRLMEELFKIKHGTRVVLLCFSK